jgi:pyruvate dehydrogenase E1 component
MGDTISNGDLSILDDLERKALRLASWTVHNANYLRENVDD